MKLGLYSQGIIEAIPVYKNDKKWGGFIVATPPLNLFTCLLSPCYCCSKPENLEKLNRRVSKAVYFPVAICILILFMVCNFVMMPIAFFKSAIHKCLLYKRTKICSYFNKAFLFAIFGLPMMMFNQVTDVYYFFTSLYREHETKTSDSLKYPKISLRAFNMFHFLVHKRTGDFCNAKELVLETRDVFKTSECIFGVLYANRSSMIEKDDTPEQKTDKKEIEMEELNQHQRVGSIEGNKVKLSVG